MRAPSRSLYFHLPQRGRSALRDIALVFVFALVPLASSRRTGMTIECVGRGDVQRSRLMVVMSDCIQRTVAWDMEYGPFFVTSNDPNTTF